MGDGEDAVVTAMIPALIPAVQRGRLPLAVSEALETSWPGVSPTGLSGEQHRRYLPQRVSLPCRPGTARAAPSKN